jgi:hypothetical protein
VPETTDPSYQDLLRSSEDPDLISDLRSSTSRDPRRSTVQTQDALVIWADETKPADHDQPTTKQAAANISERAFAAADYLRGAVLAEHPSAVVGTVPWDREARTGRRLAWADAFRRLHRTVHRAMANAQPETTEADAWTEIARTVHWVFHGQQSEARFEVESPGALVEKWDRIQTARRRAKTRTARGPDGRPDPTAAREFRTLTPENL